MRFDRILVTGGAGFIGSAVVRSLIRDTGCHVINVDSLTYAGNLESLGEARHEPRLAFERVDIRNRPELDRVFREHEPDAVIHLAAESHVDRSIDEPDKFVSTNIVGTYHLLEAARSFWTALSSAARQRWRFHHVSTDEVYGNLGPGDPPFTEETPYAPSSPYSASKAAADHLVRAWHRTYGLPVVLTHCSNNYGPYQFPEKLLPLVILNALERKELPVYGKGDNVRDWIYVEDHVCALLHVLEKGRNGATYNIGGQTERTNLEVVKAVCAHLDRLAPDGAGPRERLIRFVPDRLGHDHRYAIANTRIAGEIGWQPKETFDSGLEKTIEWYLGHREWVDHVRSGVYREAARSHDSRESTLR